MHEQLPFMLALVAAIVLIEMLATKLRIAYPVLLVVAGLLISFVPGLPKVQVDPNMIFFIFLPPLLFEASWSISFKEMKKMVAHHWQFCIFSGFVFCTCSCCAYQLPHPGLYLSAGLFTWRNRVSA